ncbi:alpha/beta hydrolase family protein [Fimbriiglobus ruber]|nr:prolyl oligopeptidase family serine peptidase [Fimbriiglobus ruber]
MFRAVWATGLAIALLASITDLRAQAPAAKRPITHADYEIWNTMTGVKLSPDGRYLAYRLAPPEGDADIVIRTLTTGAEIRIPTGGRPATPPATPADPSAPPPEPAPAPEATAGTGPAGGPQFSPDSKLLLVPLTPTKAELDKAKADKVKTDEMPKAALAIIELETGKIVTRVEHVRAFSVYGPGTGLLVYQKEPKPEDMPKTDTRPKEVAPAPAQPRGPGTRQRPPGAGGPTGGATPAPRLTFGTDLVVRNLATGSETLFADVAEYSITKDVKQIVFTVQSKSAGRNGVYVAPLTGAAVPTALTSSLGRFSRLTWNEGQSKLAFFVGDPPPAPPPSAAVTGAVAVPAPGPTKVRVFVWDRTATPPVVNPMAVVASAVVHVAGAAPAEEILGASVPGLKSGWAIVDRSGLRFSTDGLKLEVATAPVLSRESVAAPETPPSAPAEPPAATPGTPRGPARADADKVELDIWHWKDDYVQPMQKIRSAADRMRTYRAVYFLDTKQFRHLSDADTDVFVPSHGDWGLASNDKRFRGQQWLSPTPRDYSLVNVRTGEAKPILAGQDSAVFRSPDGKSLVAFDGHDWHGLSVPVGQKANLTAKLPTTFFNEEFDSPSTPPPYGMAGWTNDGKYALLEDRFDIWKVAIDGSEAVNLTGTGTGKNRKIRYRHVRLAEPEEGEDRGVDLTKPMLLAVENLVTHDTGFYRMEPGSRPKLLVMGARRYGTPTKAKSADTMIFTVSTFYDHPDYYVADKDFHEIRRVTNANPKVREFNWGKAELIHYHSADGAPLSGILIKPEDFDPMKKYPMMVYIYERLSGGLHNFTLPKAGTSINPTYYASNGYLVFMPDIKYTVGAPGQSALKCVLPAIQAVADKGYVNEAAIGIQGHSWGGYQIAYLVTQTGRFKAAAAGAPVSDMVSAYGGIRWGTGLPRQFQYERTQSRIGKTLWETPMKYIENSPIFMADRVQTPLMMLHNDQDDAVPWYQGIEYYLALRRLGKEVYLLNYNGELHGLRKKANQRDYTLRMQQFFDHHLKGAPAPEWMAKGVPYNERDKEKEQWKKLFGLEKKAQ